MSDTRTTLTVDGSPLSPDDLERVQSVHVEESLGSQDKASVVVAMSTSEISGWASPLDPLVGPGVPFTVTITGAPGEYMIDARSVSASWNLAPGGLSTLTVEGLDRSIDLDRVEYQRTWKDTSDSAIATTIFDKYGLAPVVGSTPRGVDSNTYSQQQSGTDWAFLKSLADRNGFDLHVESIDRIASGVFTRIEPNGDPQAELALGYGALGGSATASVQLLAGQAVTIVRTVPGTTDTDIAVDPGTGNAMADISLGGATSIRANAANGVSVIDAQTTATAMAERSAFAATLDVTLVAPDAPLVRARRPILVRGLGGHLDGKWLVRSVTHTITAAGHTQALALTRNALGRADSGSSAGALAGALGVAL